MKLWEKLEMEKTVTKNKDNEVLKNYYRTFGEFPFLLTTQKVVFSSTNQDTH